MAKTFYAVSNKDSAIRRLENKSDSQAFNHIYISDEPTRQGNLNVYKSHFSFVCLKNQCLKLKTSCKLTVEVDVDYEIYLNSILIESGMLTQKEHSFEQFLQLEKGMYEVEVLFKGADADLVYSCEFETYGNVDYSEDRCTMSVINEGMRSVIMLCDGKSVNLYTYSGSAITKVYSGGGALCAALCKSGGGYLLACIGDDGNNTLIVKKLDANFSFEESVTLDDGVASVCACSGSMANVVAVKGNRVYKYSLDEGLNFASVRLALTAKKVESNPSISDRIVITDYDGKSQLVAV